MIAAGWPATLFRFACLAVGVGAAMVVLYRLLQRLRCRERTSAAYAFLLPWLIGLVVFSLVPMGWSLWLSFTRYGVLSQPQWVGLDNYARIFAPDPIFLTAATNTVIFAAVSVVLGIVASLAAAVLLSLDARGMGFWRAIYYLPSVIPAVSTALLWRWIFVPEGGLLNELLGWLHLPQPGWFSDPSWVIPAFVIMGLQGACGNNMVIFLARLRGIDVQLHEAAALDGAGLWARFRHITLPQLSPVVFYHLVMGLIGGLLIFTQPMFINAPGRSGLFYAPYVYRTGWHELRMGYACALSWVLFMALMLLTMVIFATSRRWVSYEQSDVLTRTEGRVIRPAGLRRGMWQAAVILGGLVMFVPVAWMIATSLKPASEVLASPPKLLSWPPRWSNYADAWAALPFGRFLLNSALTTGLAMGAEVIVAAMVAYGFARFRFPGRRVLFGVLLATLMIPGIVLMVPVFLIWRKAGLVGTFDPLVLGSLLGGGALYVFIIHQFMKTLPSELEEAARLDGASHGRVFFQIIVPICRPVLLVVALISFQAHWNDFLGPLLYLDEIDEYTMTMGLHFFQGAFMGEAPKWHWMMAVTTVMAIPTVAIFFVAQRSFFQGLRTR
jgi:ABC-type sugar transport system permease subunit